MVQNIRVLVSTRRAESGPDFRTLTPTWLGRKKGLFTENEPCRNFAYAFFRFSRPQRPNPGSAALPRNEVVAGFLRSSNLSASRAKTGFEVGKAKSVRVRISGLIK